MLGGILAASGPPKWSRHLVQDLCKAFCLYLELVSGPGGSPDTVRRGVSTGGGTV